MDYKILYVELYVSLITVQQAWVLASGMVPWKSHHLVHEKGIYYCEGHLQPHTGGNRSNYTHKCYNSAEIRNRQREGLRPFFSAINLATRSLLLGLNSIRNWYFNKKLIENKLYELPVLLSRIKFCVCMRSKKSKALLVGCLTLKITTGRRTITLTKYCNRFSLLMNQDTHSFLKENSSTLRNLQHAIGDYEAIPKQQGYPGVGKQTASLPFHSRPTNKTVM